MNRGGEKLAERLVGHGAKTALAKRMGEATGRPVELYRVSHWIRGDRKPDTRQRAWLEDELGIGWRLWDQEVVARRRAS